MGKQDRRDMFSTKESYSFKIVLAFNWKKIEKKFPKINQEGNTDHNQKKIQNKHNAQITIKTNKMKNKSHT